MVGGKHSHRTHKSDESIVPTAAHPHVQNVQGINKVYTMVIMLQWRFCCGFLCSLQNHTIRVLGD